MIPTKLKCIAIDNSREFKREEELIKYLSKQEIKSMIPSTWYSHDSKTKEDFWRDVLQFSSTRIANELMEYCNVKPQCEEVTVEWTRSRYRRRFWRPGVCRKTYTLVKKRIPFMGIPNKQKGDTLRDMLDRSYLPTLYRGQVEQTWKRIVLFLQLDKSEWDQHEIDRITYPMVTPAGHAETHYSYKERVKLASKTAAETNWYNNFMMKKAGV
tara:strand:- start:7 stop:642 length:636 start_codon:yes stop_codon:yes gene_type:complete